MTLLELMGVMLILSLLAGSMILSMDSFVPPAQTARVADEIGQMLQAARMHAIVHQRVVRLEMTLGLNQMLLFYEEPLLDDSGDVALDTEPFDTKSWNANVQLIRGLIGQDRAIERDKLVLKFWPNGLCTPVRLYMRHDKGHERTVRLNPLTGAYRIINGFEPPEAYEQQVADPAGGSRR